METAEQARQGYLDYIGGLNLPAAQEELEENVAQEEPNYLAKLRRVGEETKP